MSGGPTATADLDEVIVESVDEAETEKKPLLEDLWWYWTTRMDIEWRLQSPSTHTTPVQDLPLLSLTLRMKQHEPISQVARSPNSTPGSVLTLIAEGLEHEWYAAIDTLSADARQSIQDILRHFPSHDEHDDEMALKELNDDQFAVLQQYDPRFAASLQCIPTKQAIRAVGSNVRQFLSAVRKRMDPKQEVQ